MDVFIPFIDDDTNEPQFEGFYLSVSIVVTPLSDPTDTADARIIRNGVALIRIEDNDSKCTVATVCLRFHPLSVDLQYIYSVAKNNSLMLSHTSCSCSTFSCF